MDKIRTVLQQFDLPVGEPHFHGGFSGLINSTYKVELPGGCYILQKINLNVFPKYEELMENIVLVTHHIKEKTGNGMDVVLAKNGKPYYFDGKDCYRVYTFVENSVSYDFVESEEQFYRTGKGFGRFQNDLADFNAELLYEVIPDFHNTQKRLENFKEAVDSDAAHRAASVRTEIEYLLSEQHLAKLICVPLTNKRIPSRVAHNDTKLNNILFDKTTGEPLCAIDLDTVMPGSVLYDFGDAVRYGANRAGETAEDIREVSMDISLFEAFLKGFLSETKGVLTKAEIDLLAESVAVLTYEMALRFLEDYLRGDVYFGASFEGINLLRARVQIHLLKDILNKLPQMKQIVTKTINDLG